LQRDKRIRHLAELCIPSSKDPKDAAANPSAEGSSTVPPAAVAFLSSVPQKSSFTPETRFALAKFLASRSSDSAAPLLVPLSRDEDLARTAFALLEPQKSITDSLAQAFRTLPFRSQAKLATALAGSVKSANRLLALAPPVVLAEPLVSSKLNALDDAKISQRLKTLTASLPPQNETINKLISQRLKSFDPAHADLARGELVFTTVCSVCHRIGVRGNLVGPQLDGIGARGIERLLEDVLDPNRSVDPAFRLHMVKRKDGSIFAGLLRREEGEKIIFADAAAQETAIAKTDIVANDESPFSLMPPGLGEAFTEQQLHDLLAYLLARK
jgi:putative heme-binding domain-containing protein